MTDANFMRMAIQAARKGMSKGEMPFGACIIQKGKVLSVAHNSAKANTDTTAHGEIQAIRAASRQVKRLTLSGATIYTTCEPCPMCFAACLWANIGRIVYACRIQDATKAGIQQISISASRMKQLSQSEVLITGDVLRDESRELFDAWARDKTLAGT